MQRVLTMVLFAVIVGGLTSRGDAADPSDFAVWHYDNGQFVLPGRLYIPDSYDPGQSYPLVLFFHGMGQRGTDNLGQIDGNINNLLAAAKARQFFLYAPQLDTSREWWDERARDTAIDMVAKARQMWRIDYSRLYVTGFSLGGGGAKSVISNYRETFAAAVPICGSNPNDDDPTLLPGKPIWLYHAVDDPGPVVIGLSRIYVNTIRTAGGLPAYAFPVASNTGTPYYNDGTDYFDENNLRYTEYASGGHTIWLRAYGEQAMYDWMLAQSNTIQTPQVGDSILFDLGNIALQGADPQNRMWNSTTLGEEKWIGPSVSFGRTTAGHRTSAVLSVTDKFAGASTRGILANSPYASQVAADTWTISTSDAGQIKIEGLSPISRHRIAIFGSDSDTDGSYRRWTRYTIGASYRDLDIAGNVSNTAVFDTIYSSSSGRIIINVNVSGASRYGGIGTVEVTALP